MEGGFHDLV